MSWVAEGEVLTFEGFEVEKHGSQFWIYQRSYLADVLKSYEHLQGESAVPAVKDPEWTQGIGDLSERINGAQAVAGQLLWLAGRTWPDIAYAVSRVGRCVTKNPDEAQQK